METDPHTDSMASGGPEFQSGIHSACAYGEMARVEFADLFKTDIAIGMVDIKVFIKEDCRTFPRQPEVVNAQGWKFR